MATEWISWFEVSIFGSAVLYTIYYSDEPFGSYIKLIDFNLQDCFPSLEKSGNYKTIGSSSMGLGGQVVVFSHPMS